MTRDDAWVDPHDTRPDDPDGPAGPAAAPLPIPLPRTAVVEQVTVPRLGAPVVVVRRRRVGPAGPKAEGDATGPNDAASKAPRVHRLGRSAADGDEPAVDAAPADAAADDDTTAPRRRRRRDPLRAPGAVTRIVFEPPPAPPPVESETLRRLNLDIPPGPKYRDVIAALDELGRVVAEAAAASRWRAA